MQNSGKKVFLTGYIDVPAERISEVSIALQTHIELTRAEPGCIWFNVTPSAEFEGRFDVSEAFVDQTSFDAHQERTRTSEWFKIAEGIPRTYQITLEE